MVILPGPNVGPRNELARISQPSAAARQERERTRLEPSCGWYSCQELDGRLAVRREAQSRITSQDLSSEARSFLPEVGAHPPDTELYVLGQKKTAKFSFFSRALPAPGFPPTVTSWQHHRPAAPPPAVG